MRYPSIDKLLEVVDSKYKLSILAAKRARQIEAGSKVQMDKPRSVKPVGIALEEILAGKLDVKY
ncbi:MAG: rpoZ [Haloplasmataceae bacterium]|jgi:DNA-directed RNA polymerase subunit omega|nr:rpoZ [Haloplasmataceae bacterium]